jgi:hypothetical protein
MLGYKLFRKMKDGYAPLFINKKQRLQVGVEYPYEDKPTKGFAHRPGWHVCSKMDAPHLKQEGTNRVWCIVEFTPMAEIKRPESQGGVWYLGSTMKILGEVI